MDPVSNPGLSHQKAKTNDTQTTVPASSSSQGSDDSSTAVAFNFVKLWQELVQIEEGRTDTNSNTSPTPDIPDDVLDWTPWLSIDDQQHIGGGGYGEVYRGRWSHHVESLRPMPLVAVKEIRAAPSTPEEEKKQMKQLKREIIIWKDLRHENIVPFIGICHSRGKYPAIVSMWMKNGPITLYVKMNPAVDRESLLLGMALGLEFLHKFKPQIVHGDFKGANVLINNRGQPCLIDFGISRIVVDQTPWATSATRARGTTRWQAPELMDSRREQPNATAESDVYSWAMTCLEVMTGHPPFKECQNDAQVAIKVVHDREVPRRPKEIPQHLWDLWERCWKEANIRPSMQLIIREALDTFIVANKDKLKVTCLPHQIMSLMILGDVTTATDALSSSIIMLPSVLTAWSELPASFVLSLLITHGLVDVNAKDSSGHTPLLLAVKHGSEAIVQLLLENGADVNGNNGYHGRALQAAAYRGNITIILLLLESGADINALDNSVVSGLLQVAASRGRELVVRRLLENGADINAEGGGYGNALQAAAHCGHVPIVRLLLDHGAKDSTAGIFGGALQMAAGEGHENVVRLLLQRGVEVNVQVGGSGTALHAAALWGYEAIVQLLLESGAEVDAQSIRHGTALQAASNGGHKSIVRLLLENGANVNAQGYRPGSALLLASCAGHEAIVRILLQSGAKDDSLPLLS